MSWRPACPSRYPLEPSVVGELVADACLVLDPEPLPQSVVRRVELLSNSCRGVHSLEAIGVAGVLHRIDDRIEELLLEVFELPRWKSVAGEVAERFGMKEPLATPQQVLMQRLVR